MALEHLRSIFAGASPKDRKDGLAAFTRYKFLCGCMASRYGFPLEMAAGVFSAVSPNNTYYGNLRNTDTLLKARSEGRPLEDVSVSSYGANQAKARKILMGADPLQVLGGLKTRSFYMNIIDPGDPLPVTVDGHMRNVWLNDRKPLHSPDALKRGPRVDRHLYEQIANGIRELAAEERLLPNQVQAVVWLAWRRNLGIQTTPQMEFWQADVCAAQLGYLRCASELGKLP